MFVTHANKRFPSVIQGPVLLYSDFWALFLWLWHKLKNKDARWHKWYTGVQRHAAVKKKKGKKKGFYFIHFSILNNSFSNIYLNISLSCSPSVRVLFFFGFSSPIKNMQVDGLATLKRPLGLNECVKVCAWCPEMDWWPIRDVFTLYTQCSWDRLWILLNPGQEKVRTLGLVSLFLCCHNWTNNLLKIYNR